MKGAAEPPILEVVGLKVAIGSGDAMVSPVRGVSFSLDRGQALALVGESGSGKSMTARSLMGLLPANAYRSATAIRFLGKDITFLPDRQFAQEFAGQRLAMIFQDPMTSLNPVYTIGDQLIETMTLHRRASRAKARERALYLLERVSISQPATRLAQYPHQLSGGMRQRVMIAMALMNEPDLIIADEPTTALDVTTQNRILDLLTELRRELGMALILITHDLAVARRTADKIAVMYAGELVEERKALHLLERPLHPYTRGLLDCALDVGTASGTRLGTIPGMAPSLLDRMERCSFASRCSLAQGSCFVAHPDLVPTDDGGFYRCVIPERTLAATESSRLPPEASDGGEQAVTELAPIPTIYRVENLSCDFIRRGLFIPARHIRAVDEVSFEVRKGEILAVVGESGSGKSTLAKMLLGLQAPSAGRISFRGETVTPSTIRDRARSVQAVFQDPYSSLNPRQRIGDIIRRPLDIHQIGDASSRRSAVEKVLALVGLPGDLYERFPGAISGGQRQRVAIARAIVIKPEVLLCDEPTSALDVSVQAQILNLLQDLHAELDLTYIIITHDMRIVRHLASRIAVMQAGRLVEIGAATQIFSAPAHPYTRKLLEEDPSIRSRAEQTPAI